MNNPFSRTVLRQNDVRKIVCEYVLDKRIILVLGPPVGKIKIIM